MMPVAKRITLSSLMNITDIEIVWENNDFVYNLCDPVIIESLIPKQEQFELEYIKSKVYHDIQVKPQGNFHYLLFDNTFKMPINFYMALPFRGEEDHMSSDFKSLSLDADIDRMRSMIEIVVIFNWKEKNSFATGYYEPEFKLIEGK